MTMIIFISYLVYAIIYLAYFVFQFLKKICSKNENKEETKTLRQDMSVDQLFYIPRIDEDNKINGIYSN